MKKTISVWFMIFGIFAAVNASAEIPEVAPAAADAKAVEQEALMQKMKERTSPTEAHKALEPLAGEWTYAAKFWMLPEGKPEETTGTSQNTMIFGGRFLKQETKGTWMNEPFEGIGYTGYDNIKAEYESVWLDSMATGLMTSSGQYDAATKMLRLSGANSCPLTGEKARPGRSELTITDNDHHTYAFYMAGPDGKEFKMMEIVYQRKS
jgi:hypothetical protein